MVIICILVELVIIHEDFRTKDIMAIITSPTLVKTYLPIHQHQVLLLVWILILVVLKLLYLLNGIINNPLPSSFIKKILSINQSNRNQNQNQSTIIVFGNFNMKNQKITDHKFTLQITHIHAHMRKKYI